MASAGPNGPTDAGSLVGLLSDADRLRVLAAVELGASTVAAVVDVAHLPLKRAVTALERLAGAGVVRQEAGRLRVDRSVFADAARASGEQRSARDRARVAAAFPDVSAETANVLRNFVSDGRLVRIPAQRAKRLAILDWLATRFEPGATYPEAQVNLLLGMVHADVAAVRRHLVDEGFLERRDGFYWRAGGSFEID